MLPDADLVKEISDAYVPVMWPYDGLGGKVIGWTKQHGNTNDDPSHLIWVVDADEKEIAHAAGGDAESSSSMQKWLVENAKAYEKAKKRGVAHLFEDAASSEEATAAGEGVVVVWFYASAPESASAEVKAAAARSKALADGVLASKKLEDACRPLVLRKFDVAKSGDGAAPPATALAEVPYLRVIAPTPKDGSAAATTDLEGPQASVDAILAAVKKATPPAATK